MGNQWIHDLVTMADAVLLSAEEAGQPGQCCRFCGAPTDVANVAHQQDCPVTLASRVLRQAGQLSSLSGLRK